MYPRNLTAAEKSRLFFILPPAKPGYNEYRRLIEEMVVTGESRPAGVGLLLGSKGSGPDYSLNSPVFSYGEVYDEAGLSEVLIHELTEGQIEFEITVRKINAESAKQSWSYAEWNPGQPVPGGAGGGIREIEIVKDLYTLALLPDHKRILLNDSATGINHFIPVSNLYSHLMMVKGIRDGGTALNPSGLFTGHRNYEDSDLKSAFLIYNKYFKRVKIKDDMIFPGAGPQKGKKKFIFFRGKN